MKLKKRKTEPTAHYASESDPQLTVDARYSYDLLALDTWDLRVSVNAAEAGYGMLHQLHIIYIDLANGECMEWRLLRGLLRCLFPPLRPRDNGEWLDVLLDTLTDALLKARYGKQAKTEPTWVYADTHGDAFTADEAYYRALLNLTDWRITYKIKPVTECYRTHLGEQMPYAGLNSIYAGNIAHITLANTPYECKECTLIHELLHCLFPAITETEKSYWLHWALELIARSILIARYDLDFGFLPYNYEYGND